MSDPVPAQPSDVPRRQSVRPAPRARGPWYLLWLLPAAALLGWAGWMWQQHQQGPPQPIVVRDITLTVRPSLVGDAAEQAKRLTSFDTPDFYLVLKGPGDQTQRLPTREDTPIGNGLSWRLPEDRQAGKIDEIEIWDANAVSSDEMLDRVTLTGTFTDRPWAVDGERYRLSFDGDAPDAVDYDTLYLGAAAGAGAAIALVVLLRLIWNVVV